MSTQPDIFEVARIYLERLVSDRHGELARFSRRTGIPHSNLSEILNRKSDRRVTMDYLQKISDGMEIPISELLSTMAVIAARLEAMAALPPSIALRSVASPEFRRAVSAASETQEPDVPTPSTPEEPEHH